MDDLGVSELVMALEDIKRDVKFCAKCGNFAESDTCGVCDKRGSSNIICVVKDPRDVIAIEKSGGFSGTYHVLHGVISPLDKKGPDDLNLKSLLIRLRDESTEEVIIATNPDVEGEATANYIASLIKPSGIKVTRIAQGLAMGSNLEYADEASLAAALQHRVKM